jgi:death-on-curing protein
MFYWHKDEAVSDGDDPAHYGILDRNKLQMCLDIPKLHYFNFEFYPTVASKAAAYLYFPNIYHVFSEANKRVCMSMMLTFLSMNMYDLSATDDELYDLALTIADAKTCPPIEIITQWIDKRLIG